MTTSYICSYVHYRKQQRSLQGHTGSFINRDGTFGTVVWKGSMGVHDCGGTKKYGVPHASWRWGQGQRPASPCGTPPRALRRPAAADCGGTAGTPRRLIPEGGADPVTERQRRALDHERHGALRPAHAVGSGAVCGRLAGAAADRNCRRYFALAPPVAQSPVEYALAR
jgi:hypothetical protein